MTLRENGRFAKQVTDTTLAPTRKSLRSSDITEDLKFIQNTVREVKATDKQRTGNAALQEARENCNRFEEEMGRLTVDLQDAIAELTGEVNTAYDYKGTEKLYSFFGKFSQSAQNTANQKRVHRLLSQTLDNKLKEIDRLDSKVNEDFKANEQRYNDARNDYVKRQGIIVQKRIEYEPKLAQVIGEREGFESEVAKLKQELETGVITETERPAKEKELAQLRVNLFDT